ncbi:tryptophan--tRNA ligase [Turneriella parva]|uniref:Tryptophan--tRNA ligase n=1 Tax=Turneriella parva (strain ATCC BAA-1111 / DSM 21527 / NCTC 11395 / H) TaxID=869212 RepID=I4BB15_TURPD|nr:tryptophan--tRNA ligase [Turneriella parva]AFM14472.1 tryptophanyl-tRNA synthetase [Turneriella parva DSM 21527]
MNTQDPKPRRILSGMQATGELHVGHYLGVLTNFSRLQHEAECFFMVANLHSLTAFYPNYPDAHRFIAPMVSDWLAAGIAPEKATIFVQSDVPEHSELAQLLAMFTPVSWLERNPTYKDKQANTEKDLDSFGFLGYPVLQAADIVLYDATHVPIGEDQLPHLELTREIARRFNHYYRAGKADVLTVPQAILSSFPKVAGLDGRKMSKSYNNSLNLAESAESLSKKFMVMKTDTARVKRTDPGNPENCTVFTYYDFFAADLKEEVNQGCRSAALGCVDCKKQLLTRFLPAMAPFNAKRRELAEKSGLVNDILHAGAERARKVAAATMARVKDSMGLVSRYSL